MRLVQRFSHAFKDRLSSFHNGHTHAPIRTLPQQVKGDVERRLYGMSAQEESAVRQVLAKAGHSVLIEQDTFAIDRKDNPRYLKQGQTVKVSECPLTFDSVGEAHVSILDRANNILSMRLSDFIHDMQANR